MDLDDIGSSNPGVGNNIRLQTLKTFEKHNLTIGTFLSGNREKYPLVFGAFSKSHGNGYSISTQCSKILESYLYLQIAGNKIIYKNEKHTIGIDGMISGVRDPQSRSVFYGYCLGVNFNHSRGHSIRLSTSYMPDGKMIAINTSFKLNIWTSSNKSTVLDYGFNITQHLAGTYTGYSACFGGLGFTHYF